MNRIAGIINLDQEIDNMNELTYFRCTGAVPFAARYRLIDFTISNMINANIDSIAIFARKKYRSLLDHLEQGKAWDLDRQHGGLFILPPDWNDPTDISKGELQHFHNNIDFIHRVQADYIIITGSQHICNIDMQDVLEEHIATKADVTVVYKNVDQLHPEHQFTNKLTLDNNNRVVEIDYEKENTQIYMNMYIMKKTALLNWIELSIEKGYSNLFNDAIIPNLSSLHVHGYEYSGTHAFIHSVESYYRNSMCLLNDDSYDGLFQTEAPILTKLKNEVPATYAKNSFVRRSMVANGCHIHGDVQNSILFRSVKVGEGAKIEDSIIMQRCEIAPDAVLKHVILDKECSISSGQVLIGTKENPFVVAKRQRL
ncbi:Glycogen biosynthesis protein GlgD [Paraliobacillus sp. PM-2]|uniref:glucose-1-phosphate adenylyltransferase subunit GlgD n=1 Tax=Paraliobacillus sp. PM-2 TaxID=1462524 RepID=UPI00061BD375|nr:glucose-1-phosphate adenylyltransferase subunit GlgD [Paraliobacillus sp. PM-2]CQR47116.1 Glycogen biosynthesis protein GlgD [Paraliobacillus sp. PM-2]